MIKHTETHIDAPVFGSTAQLVTGSFFLVLGGFLAAVSLADGAGLVVLIGVAMAVAGQITLAIGVIAKGVSLGNRES